MATHTMLSQGRARLRAGAAQGDRYPLEEPGVLDLGGVEWQGGACVGADQPLQDHVRGPGGGPRGERLSAHARAGLETGDVRQEQQGASTRAERLERQGLGTRWPMVTRCRRWQELVRGVCSGVLLLLLALGGAWLLLTLTAPPTAHPLPTAPARAIPGPVLLPTEPPASPAPSTAHQGTARTGTRPSRAAGAGERTR